MAKLPNKRKNYFIKKKFQLSFASRFILLIVLEAALIAVFLLYLSRGTLTTAYYGTQLTIEKTPVFFLKSFIAVALLVGIAVAFCGLIIFVYLSHRIAGPLYKFEKTMDDISKGDVSFRVNLRNADQLKSLQIPANNLLSNLDDKIKAIKKDINEGLKEPSASGRIKEILNNLKNNIDFFKTSK